MKKMILNFLLAFIELISISLLSPLSVNAKDININLNTNISIDTSIDIKLISPAYSKENILQNFSDSVNYFIVLKNNKNCMNCFGEINEMIKEYKNSFKGRFIVISLIDSTTLDRKRNFAENKKLMPDFNDYFFQYKNGRENFLFDNLTTGYTPELIIIKQGKFFQISYQELFDFPSLQISSDLQNKISDLFK
jgi:hypothetical protein